MGRKWSQARDVDAPDKCVVRNADEGEPGTKMISVSGNVNKPGVFEIPFGTTIREIIERTGGVTEGQTLRLVQLGGASGRIASPEQLDTPYTTT